MPDFEPIDNGAPKALLFDHPLAKSNKLDKLAFQVREAWRIVWRLKTCFGKHDPEFKFTGKWSLAGGLDYRGRGKGKPSFWHKIAKLLRIREIDDPITFVTLCWELYGGERKPTPNILTNPNAFNLYADYVDKLTKKIEKSLRNQTEIASQQYQSLVSLIADETEASRKVISDQYLDLSAMYRYTMAVAGKFDDLAKLYFDEAFSQYFLLREIYDKVWGDLIPEPLRRELKGMTDVQQVQQ